MSKSNLKTKPAPKRRQAARLVPANQVPAGFWQDAQGRMIPESAIKPIDRIRHDVVVDLINNAKAKSAEIAAFKGDTFSVISGFLEMSFKEYGLKAGGDKGNVTLTSFDGRYKIIRANQDSMTYDERMLAAKELIDQCIRDWSQGSRPEIQALVNDAFQVDKKGKINIARVLALKRLDIRDKRWQQAMQAISDSLSVAFSKMYVRFYERDDKTGEYNPIVLDVAAA
jgi:hypothetical protein